MVGKNYLPGREVLKVLEDSLANARARSNELQNSLAQLDHVTQEAVERRGKALLDLARHYLPEMSAQTVERTFAEVRRDLQEVLLRQQRKERELQAEWDQALDQRKQLESQLEQVTNELNTLVERRALVERREQLQTQLADQLLADPPFQELSQQAFAAEEELKRNEERVAESQQEAKEKLPAYQRSSLFQYLHKRRYGTPHYQHGGLTKRLDSWVARMIDYNRASQSYRFLQMTPELIAAEVERRRSEFTQLMEKIEEIEDLLSERIGLTHVLAEGTKVGKSRDELMTKIQFEQERRDRLEQELQTLQTSQNEYYSQAVDRLQKFLGNMHESALEAKTLQTAERTDDELFAEIRWLNKQLDESRQNGQQLFQERTAWEEKLGGLDYLVRRFHLSEYDSQRSMFPASYDPRPLVERYLRGEINRESLWQGISELQRFAPTWVQERYEDQYGNRRRASDSDDNLYDSDVSTVLVRVLGELAGAALKGAVQRGMERRSPIRQQNRKSRGRPPFPRGGTFTNGRGF
jgi:hypothetical protein